MPPLHDSGFGSLHEAVGSASVSSPAKRALTLLVGEMTARCNACWNRLNPICDSRVLGRHSTFTRVYRDVVAIPHDRGGDAAPTYRRIPASLTNVDAPPGSSRPIADLMKR